jgi:hypothetical protein
MTFTAYPRGFCTNCGNDRGETIVCKSCGWVDPPTTTNEDAAAKIRSHREHLTTGACCKG